MSNEDLLLHGIGKEGVLRPQHLRAGDRGRVSRPASTADGETLLRTLARCDPRHWPSLDVMLGPSFLHLLDHEKRRADRSRSPLSIVIWDARSEQDELERNRRLPRLLLGAKRETDVVGQLCDGLFAVLLPDTGAEGAERFATRLKHLGARAQAVTKLYPDELLDSLVSGTRVPLEVFPFLAHRTRVLRLRRQGYLVKRVVDVLGAFVLMVLFAPVMLAAAVAVAASSRGPVIFKQVRLGEGGVPFVFYKFRSMRCDGDDRIHRDFVANLIEGQIEDINQGEPKRPFYKIKADPRITAVGRILRRTSIDELPQLYNVLKGEMSLVGPRPPIPYEVEKYEAWHLRRILEVRPGLTGLWQVVGRSRTTFDEMVRLDLQYVRRVSLAFDLKILLKTVLVVLRCDGAN
jgi:lipopolysaccharide/colanic/teichoic acid biosynthesis glycosyltransferase